ncbi:MAG: Rid family detoxifying hydrolase [Solirubrobacterales bacterium]
MTQRTPITAEDAPAAAGPYSHAVRHGDVLYCSGSIPLDPETNEIVGSSLAEETERCLRNLEAVCAAAGTELANTLRATIYTTDLGGFGEINAAYEKFFPSAPPARVTVGVSALPKGARVEIDAIVSAG